MNEENLILLQISSLNILEQYQIIIEFYSENRLNNVEWDLPVDIKKDYYLDINEELDHNNIIIKFLSLSKIFLSFINIDYINEFNNNNNNNFIINNYILFEKNFENLFVVKNIKISYDNNLLSNLYSNLNYFYNYYINLTKEENENNNNNNIEFYIFLFFFKINIYLIFLIMFFQRKEHSMINYVKLNSNEIEELLLKIIKLSDTHKFLPCRNILILFYLYFIFLTTNNNNNNNNKNNNNNIDNNNTIRKVNNKKIFLTKLNYTEYLYPNPPLIFINVNNTLNTTNLIERFYRKNTLKLDDVNKLEKTIIVQILRILLFTFDNKNNNNNNNSIKDFFIDYYILFYYQKNNKLSENSFLLSSNDNNNTDMNNNNNALTDINNLTKSNNNNNNNILSNSNNTTSNINKNNNNNNNTSNIMTENNPSMELDFNNFIEMFSLNNNNLNSNNNNTNTNNINENNEIEKDNNIILIDILNRNSIIYIIISLYFKILKSFKKNNLIQYTNFIFRLKDSNGLLVFLRLMKQENKTLEENFLVELNNNNVNEFYSEFINTITYLNLKLVYKIIKNNDEYINKCIECKSSIMLKKLLNTFESNKKIKIIVLKLFKEQIKFFDKNWRNENVNIITEIYINLKVDNENNNLYLERKDKLGKENNNIFFKEEELIKLFEEFHEYNYLKYIKNHNEFDNYKLNQLESIYAKLLRKLTNKLK